MKCIKCGFCPTCGRSDDTGSSIKDTFLNWAKAIGENEEWIEDTFTFHSDGTVTVEGNLDLSFLKEPNIPEGIVRVNGDLYLSRLKSAIGLNLPKEIWGSLYLYNLTSAEGLTLPEKIGSSLDLSSLTSAIGLNLPKEIWGSLNLHSLKSDDKQILRVKYPQHAEKIQ